MNKNFLSFRRLFLFIFFSCSGFMVSGQATRIPCGAGDVPLLWTALWDSVDATAHHWGYISSNMTLPANFAAYPNATDVCGNGKFKVYYLDKYIADIGGPQAGFADPTYGTYRRGAMRDVLNYIASTIDLSSGYITDTIRIYVDSSYATNGTHSPYYTFWYGKGGPFIFKNGRTGIYNGRVQDYIVNGAPPISTNSYYGYIRMNFDSILVPDANANLFRQVIPYQNNDSATSVGCSFNLYDALLHQAGHVLGWYSWVRLDADTTNRVDSPSGLFPHLFTSMDTSIRVGSPYPLSFNKLVVYNSPYYSVNSYANAQALDNYWLNSKAAPDNHPIFTHTVSQDGYALAVYGNCISHLADEFGAYSRQERVSPGDEQDYVMGPYLISSVTRRTFTKGELQTFKNVLGYSITSGHDTALNNHVPYSTKMAGYTHLSAAIVGGSGYKFPEAVSADHSMTNDVGSTYTINLNDTSLHFTDADGDSLSVYPGTLVNFRGCGDIVNGSGNNHHLLQVSSNGRSITYTPRHNFFGRAQFGFNLYDKKEKGSFVLMTIDVAKGNNVSYTAGTNMVLNGDFEQGSEVKRLGAEDTIQNWAVDEQTAHEGKLQSAQFSDSQPYCYLSNLGSFGGTIIKNSWIVCDSATLTNHESGDASMSFPNAVNPDSAVAGGLISSGKQRYQAFQGNLASYYYLYGYATHCKEYFLDFDLYSNNFTSTLVPFNIGFTDGAPATNFIDTVLHLSYNHSYTVNPGTWQHIRDTVWYCSADSSNLLSLSYSTGYSVYIDNLSLKENTGSPSLPTVSISSAVLPLCQTKLTMHINTNCVDSIRWLRIVGSTTTTLAATSSILIVGTDTSATYRVKVYTSCSGLLADTVAITAPDINARPNIDSIYSGQSIILSASPNGATYNWGPVYSSTLTGGALCQNCQKTVAVPIGGIGTNIVVDT